MGALSIQAQSTRTLPWSTNASFSKTLIDTSISVGLHPTPTNVSHIAIDNDKGGRGGRITHIDQQR